MVLMLMCLHDAIGMTLEVMGTLVGDAIQGQIVAGAHTQKHCQTHNTNTHSHLGIWQ